MSDFTPATTRQERVVQKLERDLGFLLDPLRDPSTIEILANPDGKVWVERLGRPMVCIGHIRPSQAEAIIRTVAGDLGLEATSSTPLIEGELAIDGSRFAGQLPPVVKTPAFAIRKRAVAVFTLDDCVATATMTESQRQQICHAIEQHHNIVISGGTGSGKTTLLNALIAEIVRLFPDERIVIIEDTAEIQCAARNAVSYRTSPEVTMSQLVRATLRMRPDRAFVGEVRGPEALDLLDFWNTGHPGGVTTVHANDATSALSRLSSLASRHPSAPREVETLIREVVDTVIQVSRYGPSRRVQSIQRV